MHLQTYASYASLTPERLQRAANRRRKHAGRQRASSPPAAIDQTPSPGKPAGGLTESHIDVSPTPLPIAEIAEEELARTDSMTRSDSSGQITQTENTHPAAECNLSPGMAGLVNLQPACSRQQQLLGRIEFHLSLEKARLLGPQAFMTWEEEWCVWLASPRQPVMLRFLTCLTTLQSATFALYLTVHKGWRLVQLGTKRITVAVQVPLPAAIDRVHQQPA